MPLARKFQFALLILACVVAVIAAIFTGMAPDFSDAEILESSADAFDISAIWTLVLLRALAVSAGLALTAVIWSRTAEISYYAIFSLLLAIAAAALVYRSHGELADRITTITGQHFGPCDGLC